MQTVSYSIYHVNNIYTPHFQGIRAKKTLYDTFEIAIDKGLDGITGFSKGVFGTQCKGSKPLKDFIKTFQYNNLQQLIKSGQSTNIRAEAFSFLKTKAHNPISTSGVYDCSVMYLYNKDTNTHFLYHIYKDNKLDDIDYLIKTCMPEGYTHAAIVPGERFFKSTHESYLPDVFAAIKQNNPKSIVNVYHYSSDKPEVVFLRGKAYEIPAGKPQASFNIKDYRTYETFHEVGRCKTVDELKQFEEQLKKRKYDKEIKKILHNLIKERKAGIIKIQSCKTAEELDILAEKFYGGSQQTWYPDNLGCRGYFDVIKKQSFMIAEGKV